MKIESSFSTSTSAMEHIKSGVIEVHNLDDLILARENMKAVKYVDTCIPDSPEECQAKEDFLNRQKLNIEVYVDSSCSMNKSLLMDNINFLLREKQLKMFDLEDILGLSTGYISRTLNPTSEKRLSSEHLYKIAKLFSVDLETLTTVDLSYFNNQEGKLTSFVTKLKYDCMKGLIKWSHLYDESGRYLVRENNLSVIKAFIDERFPDETTVYGKPYYPISPLPQRFVLTDTAYICTALGTAVDGLAIVPFCAFGKKDKDLKKSHFDFYKINYHSNGTEIIEMFSTIQFSDKFRYAVYDLYCEIDKAMANVYLNPAVMDMINNYI